MTYGSYAEAVIGSFWQGFEISASLTEAERRDWYLVHLKITGECSASYCAGIATRQRRIDDQPRFAAALAKAGVGVGVRVRRLTR